MLIGQGFAVAVVPETNVMEDDKVRALALEFQKAGVVPHSLIAVTDDPSVAHDDAGVTVAGFLPAGFDEDVAGRGLAHGD